MVAEGAEVCQRLSQRVCRGRAVSFHPNSIDRGAGRPGLGWAVACPNAATYIQSLLKVPLVITWAALCPGDIGYQLLPSSRPGTPTVKEQVSPSGTAWPATDDQTSSWHRPRPYAPRGVVPGRMPSSHVSKNCSVEGAHTRRGMWSLCVTVHKPSERHLRATTVSCNGQSFHCCVLQQNSWW